MKKYHLGLNHYYHAPQVPHSLRYHSSNQVQEHHMIDNVISSTCHLGQGTILSQVLQLQHIDLHQHPTASVPPEKKKEFCKKLAEKILDEEEAAHFIFTDPLWIVLFLALKVSLQHEVKSAVWVNIKK